MVFFGKNIPKKHRILLTLYLLVSILSDWTNLILMKFGIYSCYTFSIHTFFEGIILLVLYYSIMTTPVLKRIIIAFLSLHIIISVTGVIAVYSGHYQFSYHYTTLNILGIFTSILYFYEILGQQQFKRIQDNYLFWVNSAFLIYFGSTFLLWLFDYYLSWSEDAASLSIYLWPIQNTASIVFNAIIIRATFTKKKAS